MPGGLLGCNPVCEGHPETRLPRWVPKADRDGLLLPGIRFGGSEPGFSGMRRVTANLVGVAPPDLPRRMVLALDEGATVRDLIDELTRRGGDAMRRAIWADEGRLHRFVLIAVDGEALDLDRLDGPVPLRRDGAEVSLFLIRPLFGG